MAMIVACAIYCTYIIFINVLHPVMSSYVYWFVLCLHLFSLLFHELNNNSLSNTAWWQRWDSQSHPRSNSISSGKMNGCDRWKCRFEQVLCASGLDKEGDERKIGTLLYCLGPDTDDVLTSTRRGQKEVRAGRGETRHSLQSPTQHYFRTRPIRQT